MFNSIKNFAQNSQTIKEARKNVKEMSLVKEIIVFILLYALICIGSQVIGVIPYYIYTNVLHYGGEALLILYLYIIAIIIVCLVVTKIEKRSLRSIGISKGNVIFSILKGLLIGFLMFVIVVIIGMALGQYSYNGFDLSSIILVIPFFFGFLIQSFAEEFQDRGWTLTFVSKRHGIIAAMLISSISFSLLHLSNKGIDLLALINIFLIAIFFSVLFLAYDNIWICGAAHAAWNFSQGIIFGFNVSGYAMPSLLKCSQVTTNLIGGGKFGPESSLIFTFVIIVAIFLVIYLNKNKNQISS